MITYFLYRHFIGISFCLILISYFFFLFFFCSFNGNTRAVFIVLFSFFKFFVLFVDRTIVILFLFFHFCFLLIIFLFNNILHGRMCVIFTLRTSVCVFGAVMLLHRGVHCSVFQNFILTFHSSLKHAERSIRRH